MMNSKLYSVSSWNEKQTLFFHRTFVQYQLLEVVENVFFTKANEALSTAKPLTLFQPFGEEGGVSLTPLFFLFFVNNLYMY